MPYISIKAYAVKHKMSIFDVIKAVKAGKIASKTIEENGKETTYVLSDEDAKGTYEENGERLQQSEDDVLRREIDALKSEVKLLRRELERLKRMMEGGVVL